MKEKILTPIKERPEYYDAIEAELVKLFKKEIYLPLLEILGGNKEVLKNAKDDLYSAVLTGRIYFYRGQFKGRFSAAISSELKRLGAQWDRKQGSWKIPFSKLSQELKLAIQGGEARFATKLQQIDKKLASVVPQELTDKKKFTDLFDKTIWKVDRDFKKNVENITVAPELSDETRRRLAEEWAENMDLWVKNFTEEEIKKLRSIMQDHVFQGGRYEAAIKTIQKSFGVSANKAKFLARQETSLLMAKFKEARYTQAGSDEYIWTCVHMPKDKSLNQHTPGNVRYFHAVLDGTRQRWDRPPVTTKDGARNHPGEDYNCRCFARPIIKFK